MVIDEAHRLKNSATQVRASLNDLNVDFTVLLTGMCVPCIQLLSDLGSYLLSVFFVYVFCQVFYQMRIHCFSSFSASYPCNRTLFSILPWQLSVHFPKSIPHCNHSNYHSPSNSADLTLPHSTLTGTPIQNNIPELYSLLNFMHKEEFEDRELFLAKFGTISTEDQVKELQEILRTYFNLQHCVNFNLKCCFSIG